MKHAILLILLAFIHLGGCADNVVSTSPSVDVLSDLDNGATNDATTSDVLDNEDSGPTDIIEPDDADTPDPFEGAEAFIIEQINQGQIPGLAAAVTWVGLWKVPTMLCVQRRTIQRLAVVMAAISKPEVFVSLLGHVCARWMSWLVGLNGWQAQAVALTLGVYGLRPTLRAHSASTCR